MVPALLLLLVAGCPAASRPPPDGGSGGRSDGGSAESDAGDGAFDAGEPDVDAGVVQEPSLVPRVPGGARRGPVELGFEVRNGVPSTFAVERETSTGAWTALTRMSTDPEPAGATVVWDSFADVDVDAVVSLRFRATVGGTELSAPFTLDVRNAPDTDRLVIVGQPMMPASGGGATPALDEAAVLLWDGISGGLIGNPRRITVAQAPDKLRASPHGRATLVMGEESSAVDGKVGLVSTPLDALAESVRELEQVDLPYGAPADVQWAPDARSFLVAGGLTNQPPRPPALWRFRVSDGLDVGEAELVTELPGPPSGLAVDHLGRALVVCGPGGPGPSKVVLYAADGRELDRVESEEFGPAMSLVMARHGAKAVFLSDSFSGPQLQAFTLGATTLDLAGPILSTVLGPSDAIFHPASTVTKSWLLVTNFDRNRVTPMTLEPTRNPPLVAGTAATNFPLADAVDLVERGSQAGSFVVASVTQSDPGGGQLVWGRLSTDGTATRGGAASLGTGTVTLPSGVSVQR